MRVRVRAGVMVGLVGWDLSLSQEFFLQERSG